MTITRTSSRGLRTAVPPAALTWAALYGAVRVWFALGNHPDWEFPGGDLLVPNWVAVLGCVASAAAVLAIRRRPSSRLVIRTLWLLAAGWTAAAGLALLDVVGGVLPGLGIPFDPPGMVSRFAALAGAALLAGTAAVHQRRLGPGRRFHEIPTWAVVGAWAAVAGCLVRLGAQAVVGFDRTPYGAGISLIVFEGGFLLAGIVLPLLLVYRLGRIFPRWMLLLPGACLGGGISAYFGVGLLQMIAAAVKGDPVYGDIGLPNAFFWVAVPAYLVWGAGLAVATYGYYLTRSAALAE
ncbi:hypothetical protein E1218_34935 [Kribbella turkmenica]|uniref:DUF3995 domain-containing protein n=1 Tax=Kribbella turkmenica TaxID=2530375 RepID=A0A4R4WCN3_9ACTN|nr:hypothetical protein [Kribbella turkmenica]TDD13115.1 hypothetical protein E1218_34935 [Kribbella turkmenica]